MDRILWLLWMCLPQEPEQYSIPKAKKQPYLNALRDYSQADGLISTDTARAVELLTAVLNNSDVSKKECLLKIEIDPGRFEGPHEFFPYQKRGLARLALANKADPGQVERILQDALQDFEESVRRKVGSSETYVQQVRKRIAELRKTDPEPAFLTAWQKMVQNRQFGTARKYAEEQGGFLSPEKKQDYLRKIEEACAEYLRSVTNQLRGQWTLLSSLEAIHRRTPEELDLTFRPPAKEELTAPSPEWEWCARMHDFVRRFREGKSLPQELLTLTLISLSLGKTWEETKVWFLPSERMAFEWIQRWIQQDTEAVADLRRTAREPFVARAHRLAEEWKQFEADARKKLVANEGALQDLPQRDLAESLSHFPFDPPELSEFRTLLEASTESVSPDQEFAGIERRMWEFHRHPKRLTVESRQTLLTYVCVAVSLRELLQGKKPEGIVFDSYLEGELRKLGGPGEEARSFGPRVQEALKRIR